MRNIESKTPEETIELLQWALSKGLVIKMYDRPSNKLTSSSAAELHKQMTPTQVYWEIFDKLSNKNINPYQPFITHCEQIIKEYNG